MFSVLESMIALHSLYSASESDQQWKYGILEKGGFPYPLVLTWPSERNFWWAKLFRFGAPFSPSSSFSDFMKLFSFLNNFLDF